MIDKHIDFLVNNKINLTISIDGNKFNNSYRVNHKNQNSFDKVMENILILKNNYKDYYNSYVSFNAVLHNRNSIKELTEFNNNVLQSSKFSISELSTDFINPKSKNDFLEIYANYKDILDEEDYSYSKDVTSITKKDVFRFLVNEGRNVREDINSLINNIDITKRIIYSTGTCKPFSRAIYVNIDGYIYPCEQLNSKYFLEQISLQKNNLNFSKITDRYNKFQSKMNKYCSNCYRLFNCNQCMFKLDITGNVKCEGKMSYNKYNKYLEAIYSYIESNPEILHEQKESFIV